MLGNIEEIQKNLKDKLDQIVVDASDPDQMITISITASKAIRNIRINPELVAKNDAEMIEDLMVVAMNKAMELAEQKSAEETQKMMSELLPPGMDLGNMFG